MNTKRYVLSMMVVAVGLAASNVEAATAGGQIDGSNIIAGTVANAFIVDGQGDDWTGAVFKLDLISGSVYNDPGFDSDGTQANLWGFVPALQWDSAVGIANDGTAGIAGGAGDVGGGPQNISGTGVDAVSVTWFNTDTGDTGPTQIGNITLTDDAYGSWELIVSFANSQVRRSGLAFHGLIFYPEPASLAMLGVGALAVLRRR